jgi:hypothetical protein
MAESRQFDSLEPLRLYDTAFLSELVGLSAQSIRKATGGFRATPLIPRVTRLGFGTVRFSGRDILAWLDNPAENSEQARGQHNPTPAAAAAAPVRRPGRPSNRERDADARAGVSA